MIVSFSGPVTLSHAAASSGTITNYSATGTEIAVSMSGVANGQPVAITLEGVDDGSSTGSVEILIAPLFGDVYRNGIVKASDVAATKAQSNQLLQPGNVFADVTVNGTINASDVGAVKAVVGTSLPWPSPDEVRLNERARASVC